jgi:ASCH domain
VRALTVRQPWAWAIIHAGKDIENRSWTNKYATGTIAVHAGSGLDPLDRLPRGVKRPGGDDLVRGAIIGVVDIVGVVDDHPSKWFRGPLGWVLRNPRPLPRSIPCAGRLGLWELPPHVRRAVDQQLRTDQQEHG